VTSAKQRQKKNINNIAINTTQLVAANDDRGRLKTAVCDKAEVSNCDQLCQHLAISRRSDTVVLSSIPPPKVHTNLEQVSIPKTDET